MHYSIQKKEILTFLSIYRNKVKKSNFCSVFSEFYIELKEAFASNGVKQKPKNYNK